MDNRNAVKDQCVVVLWCDKCTLCIALVPELCVTVYHTALTDFSLSVKIRYLLLFASAVVLSCTSAGYFSSILAIFSTFKTWQMRMIRSNNLAMTNCLENKYINIYIYMEKICMFWGKMLAKWKGVSILIEMTGEWGFFFLLMIVFLWDVILGLLLLF